MMRTLARLAGPIAITLVGLALLALAMVAQREYARLHALAWSGAAALPASPQTYHDHAQWLTAALFPVTVAAAVGLWVTRRLAWLAAVAVCLAAAVVAFAKTDIQY